MIRPATTKARLWYTPSAPIWMGELSGGRSPTCPSRSNLTSVRTSTDLQYSHTVCTLLDQRKVILAPQLGQVPLGWVIARDSRPQPPRHARKSVPRSATRPTPPRSVPSDVFGNPT